MTHKRIIFAAVILFFVTVSFSFARTWTATSGHKIDGEFVKLEGETVHIALPNNKTAKVPLDQLVDDDRKFVNEQAEKDKSPFIIVDDQHDDPPVAKQEKNATKIQVDKNTSLEILKTEAEKNNPDALCWLGIYYAGGLNICQIDKTKISDLNQKAARFAENGSAATQFSKGICYFCGYGVKLSHEEAVKWFRKSAEQNFAPAQERLAMCLLLGDGIKEDKPEAIKLFNQAVEQDFSPAMFALGFCYAMGNGVKENQEEAVKWYRKAADKGLVVAQLTLGHCYFHGVGVAEDKNEAVIWYKKAATQGNQDAKDILAKLEPDKNNQVVIPATVDDNPPAKEQEKTEQTNTNDIESNKTDLPAYSDTPIICTFSGEFATFSPDGKLIATCTHSDDGGKVTTTIWNIATKKQVRSLQGEQPRFSADGKLVMTDYSLFNKQGTVSYRGRKARRGEPAPMSFSWIRIWDVATGKEILKEQVGGGGCGISPDGKLASIEGWIRDIATGKKLYKYDDSYTGNTVRFSSKGDMLLVTYTDEREKYMSHILDASTGKKLHQFKGSDIQLSFDNKMAVTRNNDNLIVTKLAGGEKMYQTNGKEDNSRIWEVTTKKELHHLKGVSRCFSPDGKIVATSGYKPDKVCWLWDSVTGKELAQFNGERPKFSPDSNLLVTSDDNKKDLKNKKLLLWDIATGKKLQEFTGQSAHFSPDGQTFIVAKVVKSDESPKTELSIYHRSGVQPTESDTTADTDSDTTTTPTFIDTESEQTQTRSNKNGRRININDAADAVDKGLRIYNTIRSFTR
jgi:TPR repeat protein